MKSINELFEDYRSQMEAWGRAENTIKRHLVDLHRFFESGKAPHRVTQEDVVAFLQPGTISPNGLINRHNALRKFYEWLVDTEQVLSDPTSKVPCPKTPKMGPKNILSKGQAIKVLEAVPADPDKPYEFRMRLVLELMYTCSMRRSEICDLKLNDYDPLTRSLKVKSRKTKSARVVPVGEFAHDLMMTYLEKLRPDVPTQSLFINKRKNSLAPYGISFFVNKLRQKMKLRNHFTSHSFRKSSATHMLRNGAPLSSVQKLLGHSDLHSTTLYTKVYRQDVFKMFGAHHPFERQKRIIYPELKMPTKLRAGKARHLKGLEGHS